MSEEAYCRLAKVLDTLPSGFPETEDGLEIQVLKKIFTPEEADLFCDLRLTFETVKQISRRTGRPLKGLEEALTLMWQKGQILGVDSGTDKAFRMVPWVYGICELQVNRLDREGARLLIDYNMHFVPEFLTQSPSLLRVLPVEREIPGELKPLPYEQVSHIIENSKSLAVAECICRKHLRVSETPCEKPLEVCLCVDPMPGIFEQHHRSPHHWISRPISKQEAYEVLEKAEEAALVHQTYNVESGQMFLCNCCGCCCGALQMIKMFGNGSRISSSDFYAVIDEEECTACGVCAEERCQVDAIRREGEAFRIDLARCIGCGLCASTCPTAAIALVRKDTEERVPPPRDDMEWNEERGRRRNVDFNAFR